jgi:hypothetical protein
MNVESPPLELRNDIRARLLRCLDALNVEIATYPTPIPRCDAQFNHLYEQRSRLMQDLRGLDALGTGDTSSADLRAWIADFIAAPARTEEADESHLRDDLRAVITELPLPS